MIQMAKHGNMSSRSDLEVGAKSLETGIWGAFKNVQINLPQIKDEKYKKEILSEANEILDNSPEDFKKGGIRFRKTIKDYIFVPTLSTTADFQERGNEGFLFFLFYKNIFFTSTKSSVLIR